MNRRQPKVLFQIRWDASKSPGGDFVQLQKTMQVLDELRLAKVNLSFDPDGDLSDVDLVHIFNLTRLHETYRYAANAIRQSKPYVLSSIWHAFDDLRPYYLRLGGLAGGVVRCFGVSGFLALKELMYGAKGHRLPPLALVTKWMERLQWTLANAAAVLPNSEAELEVLKRDSGVVPALHFVVPNAVDQLPEAKHAPAPRDKIVLCAARIEPMKNQLSLIDAFKANSDFDDARLVFAGQHNQVHRKFFHLFQQALVPGRVEWLGPVPHDELMHWFSRSSVVALTSFFETTGLVGLEALSRGANVAMTDRGYTRDYYHDYVCYCDPYSVPSISKALTRALRYNRRPSEDYFARYSWERAATETVKAYQAVLDRN